MTLLIDIGNTRIKWAILSDRDDGGLGTQHADAYAGWGRVQLRARVLSPAGRTRRVLVSNVGGPQPAELLRTTVQETWGIEPEFIVSTASAGGVRNAYRQPEKLGVDRWLALIGRTRAHRRMHRRRGHGDDH